MRERDMTATKKQVLGKARDTAALLHAVRPKLAELVDSCAVEIQQNARSPALESYARIS